MLTHAIAQGGVRTHVRESALKVYSWRKFPCRTGGIEPASAACRSGALPTELHPRTWIETREPQSGLSLRALGGSPQTHPPKKKRRKKKSIDKQRQKWHFLFPETQRSLKESKRIIIAYRCILSRDNSNSTETKVCFNTDYNSLLSLLCGCMGKAYLRLKLVTSSCACFVCKYNPATYRIPWIETREPSSRLYLHLMYVTSSRACYLGTLYRPTTTKPRRPRVKAGDEIMV